MIFSPFLTLLLAFSAVIVVGLLRAAYNRRPVRQDANGDPNREPAQQEAATPERRAA